LRFLYGGNEWSTLRFQADLEKWSVTPELPSTQDGHYVLRHVGGFGITEWEISFVFKGKEKVEFFISATNFIHESEISQNVRKALPLWTSSSVATTTYSSWTL